MVVEPVYDVLEAQIPAHFLSENPIWTKPVCQSWTRTALPLLRDAFSHSDITFERVICDPSDLAQRKYGLEPIYHEYVRADMDDTPYVLDGTYLQYARRLGRVALPRVLIAAARDTPNALARAFVPPQILFAWRVDLYGAEVFPDIAAIEASA